MNPLAEVELQKDLAYLSRDSYSQSEIDLFESRFHQKGRTSAWCLLHRIAAGNICGAKTRSGRPCIMKAISGKGRCKFHGGMSTGARTREGIERIRSAQVRRWAKWREEDQTPVDIS